MKNKHTRIKKIVKIVFKILLIIILLNTANQIVHASNFENTKLVTGTKELVDAVISWLTGIGITVCGGYFIYYVYCLKTNDERREKKKHTEYKNNIDCNGSYNVWTCVD